ncbi:MAG: patatin-like phospholipase family protein [Sedimenticola sp.]
MMNPPTCNLADFDLFKDLDEAFIQSLTSKLEWICISSGERLFHEGDEDNSIYLVISGRLCAVRERKDHDKVLVAEIAAGEIIGEMSALSGEPRTVSVMAQRDSQLARLPSEEVNRTLLENPHFLMKLSRIMFSRLRYPTTRTGPKGAVGSVALVRLDASVNMESVLQKFRHSLLKRGPATLFTDQSLQSDRSSDQASNDLLLSGWINKQEERHGCLLFSITDLHDELTPSILRQVDRILVVVGHSFSPGQVPGEQEIWDAVSQVPFQNIDLVVLHPDRQRLPRDTREHLSGRPIQNHYHVVEGDVEDYDRVVRCITGEAVGLVLGGGGARGFAHVGVVRALREHGIPIDHVTGTSIGAYVAALVAMDWSYEQMVDITQKMFVDSSPTNDYTLPFISLIAGRKTNKRLLSVFNDSCIEDLWIPTGFVSTSLTSTHNVLFESGPIWKAIRASVSIPGVFPPVIHKGELLVDGAVSSNLPVYEARRRFNGRIVTVDVSSHSKLEIELGDTCQLGMGDFVTDRMTRTRGNFRLPSIIKILMASAVYSKDQSVLDAIAQSDLFIQPPLDRYDMFAWRSMNEIVEAGYQEAADLLEKGAIGF